MELQAQDVIIPAILGTMFGVLVVLAVLSTGFIAFCHLRSGGVFLFLLWIWICIICIIGPGKAPHMFTCRRYTTQVAPLLAHACCL